MGCPPLSLKGFAPPSVSAATGESEYGGGLFTSPKGGMLLDEGIKSLTPGGIAGIKNA